MKRVLGLILFFTTCSYASDTLSVENKIRRIISSDQSALVSVLNNDVMQVLSPVYFTQSYGGLSFRMSPDFTVLNWYDEALLKRIASPFLHGGSDSSEANVNYIYGNPDEHALKAVYAGRVGGTLVKMDFDRVSSVGKFSNSNTKYVKFSLGIKDDNGRFLQEYNFQKNDWIIGENAGVSDTALYHDAEEITVFDVPVNLTSAENEVSMWSLEASNDFIINYDDPRDSSTTDSLESKIQHLIGYGVKGNREQFVYEMDQVDLDSGYFDTIFVSNSATRDSIGFIQFTYDLNYQIRDTFGRNLLKASYISNLYDWKVLNTSSAEISAHNYKFGHTKVEAKYNLTGIWEGGYSALVSHQHELGNTWVGNYSYTHDYNLPGYYFMKYGGNHFKWSNSFQRIRNQALKLGFFNEKIKLGLSAEARLLNNWVYMDTTSHPQQNDETIQYIKVDAYHLFQNKYLRIYNKFTFQESKSDILRFPKFNLRSVFTYYFRIGKLNFTTGCLFTYFTSHEGVAYNPNLRRTYLQNGFQVGGIPLLDLFAAVRIGEVNLFVKGENLLFESLSRDYYLYPLSPTIPRIIRVGLSWDFKN